MELVRFRRDHPPGIEDAYLLGACACVGHRIAKETSHRICRHESPLREVPSVRSKGPSTIPTVQLPRDDFTSDLRPTRAY